MSKRWLVHQENRFFTLARYACAYSTRWVEPQLVRWPHLISGQRAQLDLRKKEPMIEAPRFGNLYMFQTLEKTAIIRIPSNRCNSPNFSHISKKIAFSSTAIFNGFRSQTP